MNQAIHSVDLLTWLMGPVVEIQANTATLAHERIEVEDAAVATLRFANGALGVIEATTAAYPGYLKRIEIHGSEGSAVLEEEDLKAWDFAKPRKEDKAILDEMKKSQEHAAAARATRRRSATRPHDAVRDMLEAVARTARPRSTATKAGAASRSSSAIYKAAETAARRSSCRCRANRCTGRWRHARRASWQPSRLTSASRWLGDNLRSSWSLCD